MNATLIVKYGTMHFIICIIKSIYKYSESQSKAKRSLSIYTEAHGL